MKALQAIVLIAGGALLGESPSPVRGQEKKAAVKGIDAATVAAYERLGAEYGGWLSIDDQFRPGREPAEAFLPGFKFKTFPKTKLSDVAVPFGLVVNHARKDNANLKKLAHLKNLTTLELANGVKDKHLRVLRKVGLLHTLWVTQGKNREARPRSAEEVAELTLDWTAVTNAGLKELAPLKNLAALSLEKTKVTDAGLKELTRFKKLTALTLFDTKVTDAGLKELRLLQELTMLDLRGTKVTDAGLKELAVLRKLNTLELHGTNVTDAGVAQLRKTLPKCEINH